MGSPNNFQNLGAANAGVVSPTAGAKIYSLTCHNENAAVRYLLLLDQITTPVNAQVPVEAFIIGPNEQIVVGTDYFTCDGRVMPTGLAWAFSTTKDEVTLGTAAEQTTRIKWSL